MNIGTFMELAEKYGVIGPRSRVGKSHTALTNLAVQLLSEWNTEVHALRKENEILKAEREAYASAMDRMKTVLNANYGRLGSTPSPNYSINSTATVAVSNEVFLEPCDHRTPRGTKVQLLTVGGVLVYGHYNGDRFYTHWAPCPRRRKEVTNGT